MLDVLLLLAITGGLLQGLDDIASSGGGNLDGSNTVSNSELNTDAKTLIFLSLLGNIFVDLLGRLHTHKRD